MKKSVSKMVRGGLLGGFLLICSGCEEEGPFTSTPVHAQSPPVYTADAVTPAANETEEVAPEISQLEQAPATVVQAPVVPDELQLSPALAEIVRMVQAGVSEEVLLAYIDASEEVFGLGSDEIVFLTDLGVSENVLKRLIQHDALPESQQRKLLAEVTNSLPENLAADSPATNVYPIDYVSSTGAPVGGEIEPAYEAQVASVPIYDDSVAPASTEAVGYFYDSLAPYGSWVLVEGYGLCWQPTVVVTSPSWRPYFDRGRWIYSDHGWYWLSDYSWGWATFHYGRWFRHHRIGWCWTPDLVWGPSWVSWRYSSAYCGWAPLPPGAYYRPGFGFSYFGRHVGASFSFGLGYDHFTFVPFSSFCDYSLRRHGLFGHRARNIFHHTTVVNNITINNGTIINNGVDPDVVAEHSRVPVRRAEVRDQADFKGNRRPDRLEKEGNQLVVYRPTPPRLSEDTVTGPRGEPKVRASNSEGATPLVESPRGQANRDSVSLPTRGTGQTAEVSGQSNVGPARESAVSTADGSRVGRTGLRGRETEVSPSQSGAGSVRVTRSRDELRIRGEGTSTGRLAPDVANRPSALAVGRSSSEAEPAGRTSRPDFNPVSRLRSEEIARPSRNAVSSSRPDNVVVAPQRSTPTRPGSEDRASASVPFRPQRSVGSTSDGDRSLTFTPRRRIIQPPAYTAPVTPAVRPTQPSRPARPVETVGTPPSYRNQAPSIQPRSTTPSRPAVTQPVTPSRPSYTPVRPAQRVPSVSPRSTPTPRITPPRSRPAPSPRPVAPSVSPSRPSTPNIQQPSGRPSGRAVSPAPSSRPTPGRPGRPGRDD